MTTVSRTASVPYSAQQMFDLVNDIAAYPEFMAGCVAACILKTEESWVEARLSLGHGGIQQSFVTRNELKPPKQMIMRQVEGPFKHFEGVWLFDENKSENNTSCQVSLNLDFAFKSPLLGLTVGKMVEHIANKQVDCLCQRARHVYTNNPLF